MGDEIEGNKDQSHEFYVVKTEDGEIRIFRTKAKAEELVHFYVDQGWMVPYSIKGHNFGDAI